MTERVNLAQLFTSVTRELEQDRGYLNSLDGRNGNTGDNMAENFALISRVLQQMQSQDVDDSAALREAARVLRERGKGRTAETYARGLEDAAAEVASQGGFSVNDLMPLLRGLLEGARRSDTPQGQGTLIDALIPGVLGYMNAKNEGASEVEALLEALGSARRGANRTSETRENRQVDPGAAAIGSLLEGLMRGVLRGGAGQPAGTAQPTRPAVQFKPDGRA